MKNNLLKIALSLGMIVAVSGMQYSTASSNKYNTNSINIFSQDESSDLEQSTKNKLMQDLNIKMENINIISSTGDDLAKISEGVVQLEATIKTFNNKIKEKQLKGDNEIAECFAEEFKQDELEDALKLFRTTGQLRANSVSKKLTIGAIALEYQKSFEKAKQKHGELNLQIRQTEQRLSQLQLEKQYLTELGSSYYSQMQQLLQGTTCNEVTNNKNNKKVALISPKEGANSKLIEYLKQSDKLKQLLFNTKNLDSLVSATKNAIAMQLGLNNKQKIDLNETLNMNNNNNIKSVGKLKKVVTSMDQNNKGQSTKIYSSNIFGGTISENPELNNNIFDSDKNINDINSGTVDLGMSQRKDSHPITKSNFFDKIKPSQTQNNINDINMNNMNLNTNIFEDDKNLNIYNNKEDNNKEENNINNENNNFDFDS